MTDSEKLIVLMSNRKRYLKVLNTVRYYAENREAAEDAVADVMLTLIDGTLIYEYTAGITPESFVISAARYRLARPVKTVSLDAPVGSGNSVLGDLFSSGCNISDEMDKIDTSFKIKKISQRIKKTSLGKKYQVFKLMKFGMSPREIVEFLNITMDEVINHIADIRKQAKEVLI